MKCGRVFLVFVFLTVIPLVYYIYHHDTISHTDLWEVSVKLFQKILKNLPVPLHYIQEPVPQEPQGVFQSLWNNLSKILTSSLVKKPDPQKPRGIFHSFWKKISNGLQTFLKKPDPQKPRGIFHSFCIKISNGLQTFLKSLKDVTSFSKERRTSLQILWSETDVLNIFLMSSIISALLTWILKNLMETFLAFKKIREDRRCWQRTYNWHALMNLRQHIQARHKHKRSVTLSHCSCRHGRRHEQQNKGTLSHTASTLSLGRSQLQNDLNKGYFHRSDKILNHRVSPVSPYKLVNHFQQGNARALIKKGNANFQFQLKELLKNPHSKFNSRVGLVNAVSPIIVYHVTNDSCGTGMKKSVLPGSVNNGEVGAIRASSKDHVIRNEFQKQHESATTIQENYRGYQTRKYLKNICDGNDMVTFQDEPSDNKVTDQVHSSRSSSPSYQGHSSRTRSCSPGPKWDLDSALEVQRRVQMGKVIQPRVDHDGGTTSHDMSLNITKKTSPPYVDVVFSHGLETSGINSHFLVDPAKKGAVITIQSGYRGYRARKDLKTKHQSATTIQANYRGYKTRNHPKVTNQVHSSQSISQGTQGCFSRPSSRSPCANPKCDLDSALEIQCRVQMGKVIQPRVGHGGGTTSHDMSLNITKKTSPPYVDVVSCYGLDKSGMNRHFLVDPAKEGAVVTIQSGYRGYRARKDLKTKHQSATTIQANYRGYQTRKYLKNICDGNDMVTFQDEPSDNKVTDQVHSSRSSSPSYQGHSSRTRSCSPGPKWDLDSALEVQRRVQMGKVIQPRVGHDGGTTSHDMSLNITKKTSPPYVDVVFSHWLETSGINSHFLVDPAKKGAVITIQSGYRGYRARKDLKTKHQSATTIQANYRGYKTRNHPKVTNQVHSSQSISQGTQGCFSRPSSRSPCASPKCDLDSALEIQRRVQMGKVIHPRVGHGGGTTSHDMSLNITKKTSPPYVDVVFSHWLETSGMNHHFLGDPAKEGAVVTIQSGFRGYRARKDLKTKHQSATTIQANYRGYKTRKHPKVTNQVHSSQSISQNSQGYSSRTSSRSPCESPKCDPDSAVEDQRRVQMGKVIQPRVGHDGGTTSHDMSLNITKKTSPPYVDVVFCYGFDRSGMNSHFLGDPAKEGAVVTI